MDNWHFFDIGFKTLNIFSFMLGMVFAFFRQGLFGKRIGSVILIYFASLALWYGVQFYSQVKVNEQLKQQTAPVVVPRNMKGEI